LLFLENADSDSRELPRSWPGGLISARSTILRSICRRSPRSFGQTCMASIFATYQVTIEPRMAPTTNFRTENTTATRMAISPGCSRAKGRTH
jgi:hypothetical protein